MLRSRLILRYILSEMIPTFLLGVFVFVFILLMFQALRLTEFVLIHGVKVSTILEIMGYLSTSFLPILFPMSLLFTVMLTYGRMSADSEIVAMRSVGLNMPHILTPAFFLGILVCVLSLQTAFQLAPWGNRQFELLVSRVGAMKPGVTIKEGTFSEGFFDLVVYANKVDNKNGKLQQVFIYDERNAETPITVIAREGILLQDPEKPGNSASLRLLDGNIHRVAEGRHTKIGFSTYDIFLTNPVGDAFRNKSPQSLTLEEIKSSLSKPDLPRDEFITVSSEFHKRLALAAACVLFPLIGVGLSTTANRRAAKSSGMVLCLGIIVAYWVMYVGSEGLARQGHLPPWIAMWLADFFFSGVAVWALRRSWN